MLPTEIPHHDSYGHRSPPQSQGRFNDTHTYTHPFHSASSALKRSIGQCVSFSQSSKNLRLAAQTKPNILVLDLPDKGLSKDQNQVEEIRITDVALCWLHAHLVKMCSSMWARTDIEVMNAIVAQLRLYGAYSMSTGRWRVAYKSWDGRSVNVTTCLWDGKAAALSGTQLRCLPFTDQTNNIYWILNFYYQKRLFFYLCPKK